MMNDVLALSLIEAFQAGNPIYKIEDNSPQEVHFDNLGELLEAIVNSQDEFSLEPYSYYVVDLKALFSDSADPTEMIGADSVLFREDTDGKISIIRTGRNVDVMFAVACKPPVEVVSTPKTATTTSLEIFRSLDDVARALKGKGHFISRGQRSPTTLKFNTSRVSRNKITAYFEDASGEFWVSLSPIDKHYLKRCVISSGSAPDGTVVNLDGINFKRVVTERDLP